MNDQTGGECTIAINQSRRAGNTEVLIKHPDAQDSIKGIAEWWLMDIEHKPTVDQVETAIGELIRLNLILIQTSASASGRSHYRLNPDQFQWIKTLLNNDDSNSQEIRIE